MPWNPFDQDKFSREIFFARTLLQFTLSKAVFLSVTFDRCIWWRKTSNMKGLFKETQNVYCSFENEDWSTKHPNLENEAPKTRKRSTQDSKTKHPKLENEAPKTRKRRPLNLENEAP